MASMIARKKLDYRSPATQSLLFLGGVFPPPHTTIIAVEWGGERLSMNINHMARAQNFFYSIFGNFKLTILTTL